MLHNSHIMKHPVIIIIVFQEIGSFFLSFESLRKGNKRYADIIFTLYVHFMHKNIICGLRTTYTKKNKLEIL
jgi:hypothetical protein